MTLNVSMAFKVNLANISDINAYHRYTLLCFILVITGSELCHTNLMAKGLQRKK